MNKVKVAAIQMRCAASVEENLKKEEAMVRKAAAEDVYKRQVEESVELWFSDNQTDHVKVSVKVEKQLFGEQTDFQRIDVFESREFGRFLSSDGSIVFSEKDEFIYDEMIVHVPMAVHPLSLIHI